MFKRQGDVFDTISEPRSFLTGSLGPAPSPTRAGFRAALAEAQQITLDDIDQYPAFLLPIEKVSPPKRRPLRTLPFYQRHPPARPGELTLSSAVRRMAEGSLSAAELAQQALEAIARCDNELNAFIYAAPAEAILAQAEQLDQERRAGRCRGPLHGIPISVKDGIAVQGMPNTASSRVLAGSIADTDAAAVQLLRRAGAIIMGKVHTHEFALGVTTPQSRNPWDPTRDPGGSSGGSAVSIAAGMSLASLGTDTQASIRVPSALCGVVGFKPTFGLVPTPGVTPLSWSLDHTAPMAKTVEDIARLLNVLAAGSKRRFDYTRYLNKDVRRLRLGLPVHALADAEAGVLSAFQQSVEALRSLGMEVVETQAPTAREFDQTAALGLILSRCEAAAYHTAFRGKESLYTRPVFEQLDEAAQVSAVTYLQIQRYRAAFRQRMYALLKQYDALLMPTSRVAAPESEAGENDCLGLVLNCIPWSFVGFPAISLPCGLTPEGRPVGAQLVAGPAEDRRLMAIASALEAALAQGEERG